VDDTDQWNPKNVIPPRIFEFAYSCDHQLILELKNNNSINFKVFSQLSCNICKDLMTYDEIRKKESMKSDKPRSLSSDNVNC
jgi:hypothetical protein